MSYKEISESTLLYTLVIVGLLIVAAICAIYVVKCYRHALNCGLQKEKLNGIIKSSAVFAIVPSISIVAGLISLVMVIGTPYAWFRLSVIGSVVYELTAASMALDTQGLDVSTATGEAFGLVMWAMCIAITLGNVFNIFMCKKVHLGTMNLGGGDPKWKMVSQGIFMNALLICIITPHLFKGGANVATLLSSAVIGLLFAVLSQKKGFHWLGNFGLAFCLIGSMVLSVCYDGIF